ncbi:MAG: VCBS repeat-containing protein [Deltaproteobacteria bacterium]|nr:VCBS repeat-containing protein [Deltaproteobacteria bacterium]
MKINLQLFNSLSFVIFAAYLPSIAPTLAQEFSTATITPVAFPGTSLSSRITRLYRNDGKTESGFTFTEVSSGLPAVSDAAVAWGEYDKNGDPDIIITGWDGSANLTKIFRNDNGSFVDIGASIAAFSSASVAWGDYDKDNDLDLIITGITTAAATKLYRNDNGVFNEVTGSGFVNVSNGTPGGVVWVDYDNDTYLDMMLVGYTGSTRVAKLYYNNHDGTFSDVTSAVFPNYGPGQDHSLFGVDHGCIAWGDFNNDGYLDLAYNGSGLRSLASKFRYYQYNWDGTYQDLTAAMSGMRGTMNGPVTWGDYNNDGYLDLLIGGYAINDFIAPDPSPITRVYLNYSGGSLSNIGAAFTAVFRGSGV